MLSVDDPKIFRLIVLKMFITMLEQFILLRSGLSVRDEVHGNKEEYSRAKLTNKLENFKLLNCCLQVGTNFLT